MHEPWRGVSTRSCREKLWLRLAPLRFPSTFRIPTAPPRCRGCWPATRRWAERPASERSRRLALSLAAHLTSAGGLDDAAAASCAARLVVDPALLAESDRDQNVYLGRIFTRHLTKAVPDLVFLPDETMEVVEALRWARVTATPVTVRGAASAALGGAVANDGGLVLDLAHIDKADIDPAGEVCVVGAGARLRRVHRVLARRGLALPVYPSNLGATLAGWFATGGAGLNAFGPGQVLDIVRAADVVLPGGELVRFHSDGRLDVAARPSADGRLDVTRSSGHGHREVAPDQAEAWFAERGLKPFGLADLAGSEGVLGVITQLVVAVGRRPEIGAFLLGFADVAAALRAAAFIAADAGSGLPRPANLEMVSAAHRRHAALAAADDARQRWRRFPAALSTDSDMPWRSIRGPRELGVADRPAGRGSRRVPQAGPFSMSTFSKRERRAASRRASPTCRARHGHGRREHRLRRRALSAAAQQTTWTGAAGG